MININNMKKILAVLTTIAFCAFIAGCGGGNKLRIANVNKAENTFDFVDTKSGSIIRYQKLMLDGKEVVDHYCGESIVGRSGTVLFAHDRSQIVRNGGSVAMSGGSYSTHAVFNYKLEGGVLSIILE